MAEDTLQRCPLPDKPTAYEVWEKDRPTYLSAYRLTREAESHAQEDSTKDGMDHLISARVAGYLLIELYDRRKDLTEGPCSSLAEQLVSGHRDSDKGADDVIFQVGKLHRDCLVRMFRTTTTRYPSPSVHPSRPYFDTVQDMTRYCMMADGKDYQTVKRKALARDGYRCLLTGLFDDASVNQNRQPAEEADTYGRDTVHACHILSESMMQGVDPAEVIGSDAVANGTSHAVTAVSILMAFGLEELAQKLLAENGPQHLGNLLSLNPTTHGYFDKFNLWFERTDESDRYRVCVARPGYAAYLHRYHDDLRSDRRKRLYVTFSDQANRNQELPNPELLSLHAVCARVAHMSGAAEGFDELERDVEDTRVLAFDGSSSCLLDHLLNRNFDAAIPGVA